MPVLTAKEVQKNIEADQWHSVYCFHGPEQMKARELLKRIQSKIFPDWSPPKALPLSMEILQGHESTAATIVDSALSLALGGGIRLVIVKDAQALKETEALEDYLQSQFSKAQPLSEISSIVVLLQQQAMDKRKKITKILQQKAATVSCEAIAENEREAWITFLAKRHQLKLENDWISTLRAMDPWSLDLVDLELHKLSLASITLDPQEAAEVLSGRAGYGKTSEELLEAFFSRRLPVAMQKAETLAADPEQALPLLGLLAWNARQLLILKTDENEGSQSLRLSPFLAEKLRRWSRQWTLQECIHLQSSLSELDFGIKQTRLQASGLWSQLVLSYCRAEEVAQPRSRGW